MVKFWEYSAADGGSWANNEWPEWRNSEWTLLSENDWRYDYLRIIHHNLNVGVYYYAAYLNFVKTKFEGCSESGITNELWKYLNDKAGFYAFSYLMGLVGVIASLVTVSAFASSKIK